MKLVDSYIVYTVIKRLSLPFSRWKAFKTGVIDEAGNIVVPADERTVEQNDSFTILDTMILNVKKLIGRIPGGKNSILTFAAALYLLKEAKCPTEEDLLEMLNEDAPTNSVGSGAVANIERPSFAGHTVFDVDADKVWKSRYGREKYSRYKKYVGYDELGEEIRQYAKKNPRKGIVLRNSKSGEMVIFRRSLQEAVQDPEITQKDLDRLEQYLDALFKTLGMDIEFTKHFLDRVNDERNIKQITMSELVKLFKSVYLKKGVVIKKMSPGSEAVLKDIETNINLPFVLKYNERTRMLELFSKTIMRKKNFHSPDRILEV